MYITASMLYDYLQCPHRVWRDHHGPQNEKINETNPFVELLWSKGVLHEQKIILGIGELTDISQGALDGRYEKTLIELKKGTPLIYQGVLRHGDLLGVPDLLKRLPNGQYIPIDIKSGRGLEGGDEEEGEEGKLKKHYAVQLCLYVEILKHYGFTKENKGVVIDIDGEHVEYFLDEPQGKKNLLSWWGLYEEVKEAVRDLIENKEQNKPALAGICKVCPWYLSCKKWCKDTGDLTNIFYLGRSKRDKINQDLGINKVTELCNINVEDILARKSKDKAFLKGMGGSILMKAKERANILAHTKKPVIARNIQFPDVSTELFFDIEDDPTQDFVYLHGVYERKSGQERFLHFLAKENTFQAEKIAWSEFWDYIKTLPKDDYAIYYYSSHEKTTYKRLRNKYPEIISENDLDLFFNDPKIIDLYSKIVLKYTDWPLSSYSLKDLAVYLGFKWRDETPSGALSIQWYNEYLEGKDQKMLNRIIEYNEDDCKATMVLKDGIVKLLTID